MAGKNISCAVLFGVLLSCVSSAFGTQSQIEVGVSGAQYLELPRPAPNVFIADPTIADLQIPSATGRSVIVFGKKPGTTSFIALDAEGKAVYQAEIVVAYGADELQHAINQEVPDGSVTVSATPGGYVLSGQVPNAEASEKVRATAARYIGDKQEIVNQLKVSGPLQVNLRVRVAEIQRSVTKQLGFNWDAAVFPGKFNFGLLTGRDCAIELPGSCGNPLTNPTLLVRPSPLTDGGSAAGSLFANLTGGRTNLNALIDALAEDGLVSILAEPNMTAVSGQTASFLVGGEFPVPVAQNTGASGTTISVDYKEYGISLQFLPIVMSSDHISLKVRPEVSELTTNGAVTLSNITVPALLVRRAETTIELGSGDSFAIGGLISNNTITDLNKYPGLGDLPVLGTLFRSSSFQRQETELVIIVTPYVVRPANAKDLKAPTDSLAPATDIERIFLQRLNRQRNQAGTVNEIGVTGVRLQGDAGFLEN